MSLRSIIAIASISLIALGLFGWGAIRNVGDTSKVLPGLEMKKVVSGDFDLTILVPNSFGRKYYSKPASIKRPFYMSRHEITIEQWNHCFEDGGCAHAAKQRPYQNIKHPVTLVSWLDAFTFTEWLSNKTGDTYRLPTEEEWAFAAFVGKDVTKATIDELIQKRDMERTATLSRFRRTSEIGSNGENEWEIADTTGSVWEWTLTCWFSSDEENKRPWSISELSNPELCPNRVVQGDERAHVPFFVGKVYTGGCGTGAPVDHIGFRVVREFGKLDKYL